MINIAILVLATFVITSMFSARAIQARLRDLENNKANTSDLTALANRVAVLEAKPYLSDITG